MAVNLRCNRATFLAALFTGSLFVAAVSCAAGSTNDGSIDGGGGDATTSDGASGDGGHDAGKTGHGKLPIGSECASTTECASPGSCTPLGDNNYCTEPCPSGSCPAGTYCSLIDDKPLCVPDLMQECLPCTKNSDCKLPSDQCLTSPAGDSFCARDCSPDGDSCPSGYSCTDIPSYARNGGGTPDGGTATNASGATKWCVPSGGKACKCDAPRNGEIVNCDVTNKWGTCTGQQTCVGATNSFQMCNAPTPSQEICNGIDDNCNGMIDEGSADDLCSFMGGPPANSSWLCMNGACSLGPCNPGFVAFPPGPLKDGCPCAVNSGDDDGLCDQAIMAGSVDSTSGTPLVITGTLSSATAVAVYKVTTTDTNQMTTNSYHVAASFTAPTTNTEFVMDMERGDPCTDTPTGGSTSITSYDWCVNATSADAGEAPCGDAGVHHCADHSSDYFIRVHRAAGATATCTQYQITVTGGGGNCDLTQTCL